MDGALAQRVAARRAVRRRVVQARVDAHRRARAAAALARCLVATDQTLGDALGREYVKTEFTPVAKAKMLEIVQSLRDVLRDRITPAPTG